MNRTLTIDNVDLKMLERQRKQLWKLFDVIRHCDISTGKQDEALEGVLNLLDYWSDRRDLTTDAQLEAHENNDYAGDRHDFAPLFICEGHHTNLVGVLS